MNKIKALCDKYGLSHRQLGILMGYHPDTIQKVNSEIYNMTPHFEIALKNVETLLNDGSIKIPE